MEKKKRIFKLYKTKRMDSILKGTKFSSKTKALMTYYNSGITPSIAKFINAIKKADVPEKNVKALALFLYDATRNGRSNIAGSSAGSVRQWRDEIFSNPHFVMFTYGKMRKGTLGRWNEAIKLIKS